MSQVKLTTGAVTEYSINEFSADGDLFTATSVNATITRSTTQKPAARASCMKVVGAAASAGAYKDYTVVAGIRYLFSCLYKVSAGTLQIQLYDQTNSASVSSVTKTDSVWTEYKVSIEIPTSCTTLRIKFLQSGATAATFYVDNALFADNLLMYDPSDYQRTVHYIGGEHLCLSGRKVFDITAIHYLMKLYFSYLDESSYEYLRKLLYSGDRLYFNDGDVPALTETLTFGSTATFTFSGITNPSSTHKAYASSSSAIPVAEGDFETTEFSTANYAAIAVDDADYKESEAAGIGVYTYHKFAFLSSIATADVKRIQFKVTALGDFIGKEGMDGFEVYLWDGTIWVKVGSVDTDAKTTITYSTQTSAVARKFVDSVDSYIRGLIKTRGYMTEILGWDVVSPIVGTASPIRAMVSFSSNIYAAGGTRLIYSNGTAAWATIGSAESSSIMDLLVFNTKLYNVLLESGLLREWNAGTQAWSTVGNSGDVLYGMASFNSKLYAIGYNNLYEWNGTDTLTAVSDSGGWRLIVFDDGGGDDLYGCTQTGTLKRWNGVNAWVTVATPATGMRYTRDLFIHSGELYACGSKYVGSYQYACLWKWDNASAWTEVAVSSNSSYGFIALSGISFGGNIYLCTATGYLLMLDGSSLVVKASTLNKREGTNTLLSFSSSLYAGTTEGRLLKKKTTISISKLQTYYAEAKINVELNNTIILTHKARLDANGDVVYVKNTTLGTTLVLTTNYTIASDKKTITIISGVSAGQVVEVQYNRYFECEMADLNENWLSGDPGDSDRERNTVLTLRTLGSDE